MTMIDTVRSAVRKRAEYHRTVRELRGLPAEFAVEDLGIHPGDADRIARRAVYG